jgi:hypothetical protein
MKKTAILLGLLLALASSTQAATIASWGFEANVPSPVTGTSISGLAPDFGSGSASGVHASSLTSFTVPVGNGSAHSLSADHWAVGDYWQFHVSTLGFQNIQLRFDQAASGLGATNFNLLISTDGTTFTTASSFLGVPQNSGGFGGGGGVWNSTTYLSSYTHNLDLSSFTTLNNATDVYFRLASNIPGAQTSQIDNFVVTGLAVPEPASAALLGAGALLLFVRRASPKRNG